MAEYKTIIQVPRGYRREKTRREGRHQLKISGAKFLQTHKSWDEFSFLVCEIDWYIHDCYTDPGWQEP